MADIRLMLDPAVLDPAPWNPKTPIAGPHRKGLAASLDHFGIRDDFKVWPNPDAPGRYYVLDGNQRLDLLRDRAEPIECRVLSDLDQDDAKLFTAAFDRNRAAYDEVQLESLAASLTAQSAELRARMLRLDQVALTAVPAARPAAPAAAQAPPAGPTVPLLIMLTQEGAAEVRASLLKIRGRLAREDALKMAMAELADRDVDSAVIELALRICDAQRAATPKTR